MGHPGCVWGGSAPIGFAGGEVLFEVVDVEVEAQSDSTGDRHLAAVDLGAVGGGHRLDVASGVGQGALDLEEVLDGAGEVGVGVGHDERAYVVQGDWSARERGVVGDLLGAGDAAGEGEIRVGDVDGALVEEGAEAADELKLFSGEQAEVGAAAEIHPSLVKDGVEGVFDPEGIHGFDRLADLDGAGGVELSVAVNSDVDVIADGLAGVVVAGADGADLLGGEGVGELTGVDAEDLMDVVLVDGEAFGTGVDAGCPVLAGGLVEHVEVFAVGVHGNGLAEAAAEELPGGAVEDLAGEVPEGYVDATGGGDVADVVVHEVGHVLEVDLDGEGVLADEEWLEGLDAGAGDGSGGSGFAEAEEAGVGVDADEAVAGHVVEAHGLDAGDLDLTGEGLGQQLEAGEEEAGGQHRGVAHPLSAGEASGRLAGVVERLAGGILEACIEHDFCPL